MREKNFSLQSGNKKNTLWTITIHKEAPFVTLSVPSPFCRSRRVAAAAVVFHPVFSGNNKVRVPGTRARVPSERVRTACCRACESACADAGDVNVCNHKLESFVMATAPSASYPGNALLCHCAVLLRRRRRRRWQRRVGRNPPPIVRPSFLPTSEKLDETAELIPLLPRSRTLSPTNATRGRTNSGLT